MDLMVIVVSLAPASSQPLRTASYTDQLTRPIASVSSDAAPTAPSEMSRRPAPELATAGDVDRAIDRLVRDAQPGSDRNLAVTQ